MGRRIPDDSTGCLPEHNHCLVMTISLVTCWLVELLYDMTVFVSFTGYVIPFAHLPQKAVSEGVPVATAKFLISIVWVANMISRLIMGWIADRPWGNPIQLNNISLVLAGFLTFFSPMYKESGWLVFYAVFFGVFTGRYIFSLSFPV